MHKYIAQQQENGSYQLIKDGNPCNCPKTMSIVPMQGGVSGMRIQPIQLPCSTNCPFAEIHKITEEKDGQILSSKDHYVIKCEGGTMGVPLDEIKTNKPASVLSIK